MRGFWSRACGLAGVVLGSMAAAGGEDDLARMSLSELGDVEVTSVSRTSEQLRDAPAALYVITHEEIERSGATNLVEALRLAPNLLVFQRSANDFDASARGFGGNPAAQNFSNKILLLIDGRSVYSPLFSGIFLDVQDVMVADIDRIEVISGPGATLWGANAVNGVINVITRPAWLTDGTLAMAAGGPRQQQLALRQGQSSGDLAWRAWATAQQRDASLLASGAEAGDEWRKAQAGFRMDITRPDGQVTLQGDGYRGDVQRVGPGRQSLSGANLLGRWQRQNPLGELQLQGYFDHSQREAQPDGVPIDMDTWDIEVLQGMTGAQGHRLVVGGGLRAHRYRITNSATLLFEPPRRNLMQWNLFAQDTLPLAPRVDLTLGLKIERNDYSGWEPQPDLRLAWRATPNALLWASVSRAVRSPTPFDADVVEYLGSLRLLQGNPDFRSESVLAYELGYRGEPLPEVSLSVTGFFNVYDDLRTVEFGTPSAFPLRWDNRMKGRTWGLGAYGKWQVTSRWRLSPGVVWLHKDLRFKAGSSRLLGIAQAGNDPRAHALLTSSLDLGAAALLDLTLRHVASLPDPALPAHTELSARFAWKLSRNWQVALTGTNLLHDSHVESPTPGRAIRRSVFAEARWSR